MRPSFGVNKEQKSREPALGGRRGFCLKHVLAPSGFGRQIRGQNEARAGAHLSAGCAPSTQRCTSTWGERTDSPCTRKRPDSALRGRSLEGCARRCRRPPLPSSWFSCGADTECAPWALLGTGLCSASSPDPVTSKTKTRKLKERSKTRGSPATHDESPKIRH